MDPQPSRYSESSQVQRRDAIFVLEKHSKQFRWINDGQETLLDIGCGTGDITNDLILPLLPKEFGEVVGVDISQKMVNYATQRYERKGLRFEVLNIEGDIHPFLSKYPRGFDHVTSFYALHWMRCFKTAMKNICDLLKPGGDCLLVFLIEHSLAGLYDQLAKDPKWGKFMPSIHNHYSPFVNRREEISQVTNALDQAGFSHYKFETLKEQIIYKGADTLKANLAVVHPAINKMNSQEQNEYWSDFMDLAAKLKFYEEAQDPKASICYSPYELAIVYAVK